MATTMNPTGSIKTWPTRRKLYTTDMSLRQGKARVEISSKRLERNRLYQYLLCSRADSDPPNVRILPSWGPLQPASAPTRGASTSRNASPNHRAECPIDIDLVERRPNNGGEV